MAEHIRARELIIADFYNTVHSLIIMLQKFTDNDEDDAIVDRLQKRIMLVRYAGADDKVIHGMNDILAQFHEQIKRDDIDFFLNLDYAKLAKDDKRCDNSDISFVTDISRVAKAVYKKMSAREQRAMHDKIISIYCASLEYCS